MHPPQLLDQVRAAIRLKHYSIRTEEAYVQWIKRFVLFHNKRHPNEMGAAAVAAVLTHLAVVDQGSAATQNQALAALLLLYREVLHRERGAIDSVRARTDRRLPSVWTRDEVQQVIARLTGTHALMARLRYGSGLRRLACLRLRVKDVDIERRALLVRDTKGTEDRVTVLPKALVELITDHLRAVRCLHAADLARGYGAVYVPDALERKYPTPPATGSGRTSSHPTACRSIRALASFAATMPMKAACKKPLLTTDTILSRYLVR